MRELNRLQWLDLMTGQMDRHNNNYFIHIDKDTHKVTVTGIDNDAGYSKYRTGAVTYTLDENRTKSFKKCLENIGKPLGFHRDPGEFVDRLLKDPGITIRDDGNITIDASKVKDKTLIYALTQAQGVQTTAIPDKIDRQTYDAFMALKSGPKREEYLDWFYKTLDYCRAHFADPEYGEWYGYLRRDGKPTEPPCKGSTFKGPFHLPRMLTMVDVMLGQLLAE